MARSPSREFVSRSAKLFVVAGEAGYELAAAIESKDYREAARKRFVSFRWQIVRQIFEPLIRHLDVINFNAVKLGDTPELDAVIAIVRSVEQLMRPYEHPAGPNKPAVEALSGVAEKLKAARAEGLRYANAALRKYPEPLRSDAVGDNPFSLAKMSRLIKRWTCRERNEEFVRLYEAKGTPTYHRPARIRDDWNHNHPDQQIGEGKNGYDVVKKGMKAAWKNRAKAE